MAIETDSRTVAAPNRHRMVIEQICRRYGLLAMYAFGSREAAVRDWLADDAVALPAGPSDVDIAVIRSHSRPLSLEEVLQLAIELEDVLDVARVDLVRLERAGAFLALAAIRGERVFSADRAATAEFELYVMRRAGDLVPFERERARRVLEPRS